MSSINIDGNVYFDYPALIDRLTDGIRDVTKEVTFVVGAPLTAPFQGNPGVADVAGVVDLIRKEFASSAETTQAFDLSVAAADNKYQAAFSFLQGRRGQDRANKVIRQAVWQSNRNSINEGAISAVTTMTEDQLEALDKDLTSWVLSPAAESLGDLITNKADVFGRVCITSNFDPLIEVSIKKARGEAWRTSLFSDGSLDQSRASGCQVIHLHGYWHGSDTLHTGNQLVQRRPSLKSSLLKMVSQTLWLFWLTVDGTIFLPKLLRVFSWTLQNFPTSYGVSFQTHRVLLNICWISSGLD